MSDEFMDLALAKAAESLAEGGIPVGSVLVENGQVIGAGHNRRVQDNDPIAHGEMDCIRSAGRRRTYKGMTLYTTLSPCLMCSGTIVQFGIARVVIGENETFGGNEGFLRAHGVTVEVRNDSRCKALMEEFVRRYPQVWREDIGQD